MQNNALFAFDVNFRILMNRKLGLFYITNFILGITLENEIFASADSNDYHKLLLKVTFEENNSSFDELMFFFF